jgi:hypothetical protein
MHGNTAPVLNISLNLPEVALLDSLQFVCDTVKFFILWCVVPDIPGSLWLIAIVPLETGTITLTAETGEPDTGFFTVTTVNGCDYTGIESHAQDVADLRKILVNVAVPVILQPTLAVPDAGFLAGRR